MRAPRRAGIPGAPQPGPTRPRLAPLETGGWKAHEKRIAAAVPGGKVVRGSGSSTRPSRKSDVTSDEFQMEGKLRQKVGAKSISLKRETLLKVIKEARDTGRTPGVAFGFDGAVPIEFFAFQVEDARALMEVVSAVNKGEWNGALSWAQRFKR